MCSLFDSTFTTDDGELASLLASPDHAGVKAFLEGLWRVYYARVRAEERAFRGDLRRQPHARIWEMYLAVALEKCGLDLAARLREGPDVCLQNPTLWVEAIASTDGDKPNESIQIQPVARIPEILLSESMCGGPDESKIILRCLRSIDEKLRKLHGYHDRKGKYHRGYLEKNIVNKSDPYVIALNTHRLSHAHFDHQHTANHIPLIAKVVFGYGKSIVLQLYATNGLSRPRSFDRFDYEYRPCLGGLIRTDIFFQEKYSAISALIVSKEGFWSWQDRIPTSLSEDFTLVRNPLADNPLPENWLKSGHEIWIEDAQLHKRIWKNGTEHLLESFPLPICWLSEAFNRTVPGENTKLWVLSS